MTAYDKLPVLTFVQILEDEEKIHLLGIEDPKEAKKVWEEIKQTWSERHPNPKEKEILPHYKNALSSSLELQQKIGVMNHYLTDPSVGEEAFKAAKIPWIKDDPVANYNQVKKLIDKFTDMKQMHDATLEKIASELKEAEEREQSPSTFGFIQMQEALASLEIVGKISLGDYDKVTCGRYDALNKMYSKQMQNLDAQARRNNRK